RFSSADRKHFYIISRSSVFECIALLDLLKNAQLIELDYYKEQYAVGEEISKITLAMIKSLNNG
ncbi:MAG: four helix bundle protein, partial [Cyclobacteriaceae bacterium]